MDEYANVVHLKAIAKSMAKTAGKVGPLKLCEAKTLHVWQGVNHRLIELGEKAHAQKELDKR